MSRTIRKIEGVWPSEIQIGPNRWTIKPVNHVQVYLGSDNVPLETFIFVDHHAHVIGMFGEYDPPDLSTVLAALIMGDDPEADAKRNDGAA